MSSQTFKKRDRERIRQERQADKLRRREERRSGRDKPPPPADGSDPDLAGIVPGPQPLPEE